RPCRRGRGSAGGPCPTGRTRVRYALRERSMASGFFGDGDRRLEECLRFDATVIPFITQRCHQLRNMVGVLFFGTNYWNGALSRWTTVGFSSSVAESVLWAR